MEYAVFRVHLAFEPSIAILTPRSHVRLDGMPQKLLYKYRSFAGYWRPIFANAGFWFSVARYLDDDDEVAIEFDPPYLEDPHWTDQIRYGCSLLSLGTTNVNQALWAQYADKGRGFCVEADFTAFHDDVELYFTSVSYIDGSAKVRLNENSYFDIIADPKKLTDVIWKRLYFEKDRSKWANQEEVRFLHQKTNADGSYKGFLKCLSPQALKRVFYLADRIDLKDLIELQQIVEEVRIKHDHKIELVSI